MILEHPHPCIVRACFGCQIVKIVDLVHKNGFGTTYLHWMQGLAKAIAQSKSYCVG